jgi:hypothetical protein
VTDTKGADEQDVQKIAVEMKDDVDKGDADDLYITLSTGVKVRPKAVPPLLLVQALGKTSPPKPPLFLDPKLGREIPNENDPDYQAELTAYQMTSLDLQSNIMLVFGLEVVEVPEEIEGVDSKVWVDNLELVGLETFPKNKNWRRLQWIKTIACGDGIDMNNIINAISRLSGVSEEDVAQVGATFPSN